MIRPRYEQGARRAQPGDGWHGIPGHSRRLHRLVPGPQRAQGGGVAATPAQQPSDAVEPAGGCPRRSAATPAGPALRSPGPGGAGCSGSGAAGRGRDAPTRAAVYAAHALYGFIGPAAAFVLLGIIGVATMLAAALHGPALAGLGLAGSLVVPMLVSSQTPSPWPLVIYLGVVAAAAYALARLRRWLWLAAAVVVGVFFWGLALMGQIDGDGAGGWASALFVHVGLQL